MRRSENKAKLDAKCNVRGCKAKAEKHFIKTFPDHAVYLGGYCAKDAELYEDREGILWLEVEENN